jgi:thiamine phosphate synthase YjbQ (UPF0047 family)
MVANEVAAWLHSTGIITGLLPVFCRHTSASLLIQENADPTVCQDLEAFFRRLVPVQDGRMALGTWQGIYLWDRRAIPHRRALALQVIGD